MYDSSLKYKWDNKNVLDYAVTTAEAKGIQKGLEKGIEKVLSKALKKESIKKPLLLPVN